MEQDRFIEIPGCVVGTNLNLSVVRGFAALDLLADVSKPDVFDTETNPLGTQRPLTPGHAKEATEYALASSEADSSRDPRAFTEVILNAREDGVVVLLDATTGEEFAFDSHSSLPTGTLVTMRINVDAAGESEQISVSRVDGNHRLSSVLKSKDDPRPYPVVPFAMFVGLTLNQERKLFCDINGTPKKMDTSHLINTSYLLKGDMLLHATEGRAAWYAKKLEAPGKPFHRMVHDGGSKKGTKESTGTSPALSLKGLQASILETVERSTWDTKWFGAPVDESADAEWQEMLKHAGVFTVLLERYWTAVSKAYPAAWSDKKNYVLLQAIGMHGFGRLAGVVIDELLKRDATEQSDFDDVLRHVSSTVVLNKSHFESTAGFAGHKRVEALLLNALDWDGINSAAALKKLEDAAGFGSVLDGAGSE